MFSLVAQMVKNLPAMQETEVCSLGQKDLGKRSVPEALIHSLTVDLFDLNY